MVFVAKMGMVAGMQWMDRKGLLGIAAVLAIGSTSLWANVDTNPYAAIVERNPFGLKPPPTNSPVPEQTAPAVPMAKVTLTGLLSTFGEPRVLLEIIEEPGKGGGTPKKPILREGERMGPVEVLSIDVAKNTVKLRNSGVETNITFEVAKAGPVPGGPGVPGAAPTYTPPPPLNIPQPQNPQASAPTMVTPNGSSGGAGVTLMGNNPTASTGVPGALGTPDGGMRTIPSRPLRTENTGGLPPMTKEQAEMMMEVNRRRGVPPPPVPGR